MGKYHTKQRTVTDLRIIAEFIAVTWPQLAVVEPSKRRKYITVWYENVHMIINRYDRAPRFNVDTAATPNLQHIADTVAMFMQGLHDTKESPEAGDWHQHRAF